MARAKAVIDAVIWKMHNGEYSVEVKIVGKPSKKDMEQVEAALSGWRLVAEGHNPRIKKHNEYLTYKFEFEDQKGMKAWAKQFPQPIYEKNMSKGTQKILNRQKVKNILKERQANEKEN